MFMLLHHFIEHIDNVCVNHIDGYGLGECLVVLCSTSARYLSLVLVVVLTETCVGVVDSTKHTDEHWNVQYVMELGQ